MTTRSGFGSRLAVAFLVLSIFGVFSPQPAIAAGCHTACGNEQPPNCLGCTFMGLSYIMCLRLQCNFCQEDYCWVGLPTANDQLAGSEAAPAKTPQSKVLRVEFLAPRT